MTKDRGKPIPSPLAEAVFATVHPSAVLRAPDPAARALAERELIADLTKVARYLRAETRQARPRGTRTSATRTEKRATKTSGDRTARASFRWQPAAGVDLRCSVAQGAQGRA